MGEAPITLTVASSSRAGEKGKPILTVACSPRHVAHVRRLVAVGLAFSFLHVQCSADAVWGGLVLL